MMRLPAPLLGICVFCMVLFSACNDETTTTEEVNIFDFSDAIIQEIYNLQYKRDAKGLLPFLTNENPTYRYTTAMAFASIQDTMPETIEALGRMLLNRNEDESIRAIAAFALGQTKHASATQPLLNGFVKDVSKASYLVNGQILEAMGRCGSPQFLDLMSAAPNYIPTDTLMLEGQAWGIYRYMLRNITSETGTNRMFDLLDTKTYPTTVRRIAANYFARSKSFILTPEQIQKLTDFAENERDNRTRMALVLALGNLPNTPDILTTLQDMFREETDHRVKVNILRSLKNYEYIDVKPIFLGGVRDVNPQVASTASAYFVSNGIREDVELYNSLAQDSTIENTLVRIDLFGAALAYVSYTQPKVREFINNQLKYFVEKGKTPYIQGAAIEQLGQFALNFIYISDKILETTTHPYVKSAGVRALGIIRRDPRLQLTIGPDYEFVLSYFRRTFKSIFETGDVGMMSEAATILREPGLNYKAAFAYDLAFLQLAKAKLKLPKDIETYNEIQKTINYFTNTDTALAEVRKHKAIDWQPLTSLTAKTTATIQTNQGNIVLQFYPVEAPASVSNFIKLANAKYYDGKAFHRVVPNFVIQNGCPRGDGWGSTDGIIRSEFAPLKYDGEGWVGMASAGKDTESSQWFITHSPTPHLDGRYTIFAKVISGLEVVQKIKVGDVVEKVTIQN